MNGLHPSSNCTTPAKRTTARPRKTKSRKFPSSARKQLAAMSSWLDALETPQKTHSLVVWATRREDRGAPASYLRDLPAHNSGLPKPLPTTVLAKLPNDYTANLLFHSNGSLLLRAFTSRRKYARIWNWEVAERLLALRRRAGSRQFQRSHGLVGKLESASCAQGREPSRLLCKAFAIWGPCGYCQGTGKVLPALYASDHDMFAFVVNDSAVIAEPGKPWSGLAAVV